MKKCDKASPSIILAGRALLVKMLITLEPDGIFGSNFVYLCILTLSSTWYAKTVTRLRRASFWGRALLMKMFKTFVPHGIFCSNFAYLCILTLPSHWYEKIGLGFTEDHFGQSSSFCEIAHNS